MRLPLRTAPLRLAVPTPATPLLWRINGWPCRVRVWTEAEYRALAVRPLAQRHETGVWVSLEME